MQDKNMSRYIVTSINDNDVIAFYMLLFGSPFSNSITGIIIVMELYARCSTGGRSKQSIRISTCSLISLTINSQRPGALVLINSSFLKECINVLFC